MHRSGLVFVSLICGSLAALFAQGPYGRVTGRVVDSGGAVVPGAGVRVTNVETNVITDATSDSQGNYEARNLIPGRYEIAVEMRGFKRYQRGPFELRVGDVLAVDVGLELGVVTESVTVTTEASLLESATASLGQVVDRQRLLDLSMPSSNSAYLIQLVPGVVYTTAPSGNWQLNQAGSMSNFSTSGTATQTSEFTLDGAPNMSSNGMIDNHSPMPEVLQEFRVQTAAFDASVGHFTGSQVNMVIKSGANSPHASVHYQYNGRPLMAHPFFVNRQIYDPTTGPVTQAKINGAFPPTRMNRFRIAGSGPTYVPKLYDGRNRTFFTYGIDLFSRDFVPGVSSRTVPSLAQRKGDFSALLALGPQYQIYDPFTVTPAANGRFSRLPLAGNIIPTSRLDPMAQRLIAYYPEPNMVGSADGLNNYSSSPVNKPRITEQTGRLDHVITANHRFFLSVVRNHTSNVIQNSGGFPSDFLGSNNDHTGIGIRVGDVIVARPDLVLDLRYGLNRHGYQNVAGSAGFDLASLGLPAALVGRLDGRFTTLPQLNIDSFSAIGGNTGAQINQFTFHFLNANLAHSRANHSLRFGAELRVFQINSGTLGNISPSYTFSSNWTRGPLDNATAAPVGQGLASFVYGLPTGGSIDRSATLAEQSKYMAFYLQDDWKVTRRLTVNLGLRYELELPTTERFNRANRGFDFSTPNPVQAAAQTNYARNPIAEIPAADFKVLGGLQFAGVNGVPRGMWSADKRVFMPRAGLAFHLNPTTVIRAGYGIFFEALGADRYDVLQQGFSQTTTLVPSLNSGQTFQATLANPFPNGLLAPTGASGGLLTATGQSVSLFWPDRHAGYVQRWTLNVQRELPRRMLVEVRYVGNRGTGLSMDQALNSEPAQYLSRSPVRDQNTINYLTAAVPNPFYGISQFSTTQAQTVQRSRLLTPYPHFTGISTTLSAGYSWYHGLEMRAEKRLSRGFSVQGSYTWSKFMDASQKLNPTDPYPVHSISSLDRPHHFAGSGIYEMPVGKGRRFLSGAPSVADHVLGGWSVQAIYQKQSGAPISFGNIIFTGDIHQIPIPSSERSVLRWFNTDAGFNRNSQQQLANNIRTFPSMLSGLRACGVNNWDVSIFKGFRIAERLSFQLRAEAADGLNYAQFSAPNANPSSTLFGQVNGTVGSQQRVITIGGKLSW
jgi:hypothetical protein